MFAIVKTGGKQYRVTPNQVIKVEKLEGDVGSTVALGNVLMLSDGKKAPTIGQPVIEGASVQAEILEQKRDTKVLIFKKKRRKNHRRKNGHRQDVTIIRITEIGGVAAPKKIASPKKDAEPKAEAASEEKPKKKAAEGEAKPKTTAKKKKED